MLQSATKRSYFAIQHNLLFLIGIFLLPQRSIADCNHFFEFRLHPKLKVKLILSIFYFLFVIVGTGVALPMVKIRKINRTKEEFSHV